MRHPGGEDVVRRHVLAVDAGGEHDAGFFTAVLQLADTPVDEISAGAESNAAGGGVAFNEFGVLDPFGDDSAWQWRWHDRSAGNGDPAEYV